VVIVLALSSTGAEEDPPGAMARAATQRPRRSPPKGQHLLLVGRVAVRLNEIAGSARQPLSIVPRHVSHLGRDDLRDVSDPTFLHIERQDPNRSIVLPV
jgi:hypothetical protein